MSHQTNLFDELSVVLFAGGGGSDTGISCATGRPVDIAINHSLDAIRMHKTNHPWTQHYQEDVFAIEPEQVCQGRRVGVMWASPDCTHFSKAKGGKPVKKEIRGLSWVVVKWALKVRPRVMFMENVEEIETWGPCIETERGLQPDKTRAGETYKAFIGMLTSGIDPDAPALTEACEFLKIDPAGAEAKRLIKGLGYDFDSRILCAADYGVPTIRKRWFAVFRCDGRPVCFPEPTHARDGAGGLKKWRSAAEIIDWSLPCPSIFDSRAEVKEKYGLDAVRPLADNTLRRVIRGVDKFTIKSGRPFIVEVNHKGEDFRGQTMDEPLTTITGKLGRGIAQPVLSPLTMTNSSNSAGTDGRRPLNTARTGGGCGQMLITPHLIQYHSEHTEAESVRGQRVNDPIMTIDTQPRYALAAAQLTEYFGNGQPISASDPIHTVTGRDREALTLAHIVEFKGQDKGQNMESPLRTVTASAGEFALAGTVIRQYSEGVKLGHWPEVRALLNRFCGYSLRDNEVLLLSLSGAQYYISDIGLRMMTPRELYNAMGFPPDYIIGRDYQGREYSKSAQVARCGNAVCPPLAGALVAANLREYALPVYIVTLAELWTRVAG